jgi:hypothetical protein
MALMRYHYQAQVSKFFKSLLYSLAIITISTGITMMMRWGLHDEIPLWIWLKFLTTIALVALIWVNKYRPALFSLVIIIATYASIFKPL